MNAGNGEPLETPAGLERLRRAFAAEGPAAPAGACPSAEKIFAGAHGELAPAELGELLDHLAVCPSCSEEWRLAVEVGKETAPAAATGGAPVAGRFGRRVLPWTGLAAALLLAAVSVTYLLPPQPPPVSRGQDEVQVRDASGPLERLRCVLRWRLEPPREGARYTVKVTSENLEPLADRAALLAAELAIPPERLAAVPPGGELLWQVEATLPDGRRVLSPTFRSRLP